jgi:murein DD-endopeptidase MepM/ murein hydrolase activator NlpD
MVSKLDTKLLGMMFALPSDQITDTNHLTIREILIEYTRVRALNINPGEGAIQTGFLPIPEIPKTALELEVHRVAISNMAHSVEHNGSEETAAVTGGKIRHRIEAAKLVAGHAWGPLETEQRAALYIFFDIPIPPAIRERIVSKSTDPVADKNSLAVPLEFVGFTGDVDKITEAAWRGKFRVLDFGETQQRPTIQKSEVYQDIVNLKRLENELILAQYTVLPEDQQIAVALQLQQTPEDLQLVLAQSVGSMDDRVVLSAPQTEEFAALATAAGAPAASGGDFSPQTRAAGLNSMASGAIKDLVTKKLGSKLLEYGAAAVAGPAGWALQLKNIARVGQKLINNKEFRQIVIAGGSGVGLAAAATFLYAFGNIPGALTMIASFIVGGPIGLLYGLPLALGVAKLFPGLNWLPVRTPPNPFGFEGSEQSAAGYKSLSEMREANSASAAAKNGGTTSVNEGQTATARSSTTQTPSQAQAASQAESAGAHNPQSGVTQAFSTPATATATTSSSLGFLSAGGIGLLAPVLAVAPVFLITLLTITVIAGAFLVNLPTKPFRKIGFTSTGEQASAKYVTVTKTPDKGNNPNEIANNTATTINYTVTIAPKPGYTIKITEATDTFSSFGEQTSSDPISSTFAVSQIPTEVLTTQAPPITYTAAISNKFKDAYITNTFSIQFTVMDTTGNIVENNQIFNAAANVLIGEPKIGCWPVTGVLTTYPFMKSVPTHATTDAFDIGAPLGTPIYAPFPGSINDRDFDRRGYGNLITLEFVIPGDSTGQKRVVFFAHLSGVAAKFKGKNAEPVAAGEVIGYVGSTGNSTGPHLHYELKNNRNNPGDPGLGIRNIVPGGLTATVGTPTRSCK